MKPYVFRAKKHEYDIFLIIQGHLQTLKLYCLLCTSNGIGKNLKCNINNKGLGCVNGLELLKKYHIHVFWPQKHRVSCFI